MIRPIACVLGGMLFAGTAVADQLPTPPLPPLLSPGAGDTYIGASEMLKQAATTTDHTVRSQLHVMIGASDNPCTGPARDATQNIYNACLVAIGLGALKSATLMYGTIAVGTCSGASLTTESMDILVGDHTSAPVGKDGFVNIGNKLCFWRDTGTVVDCPPPEPECQP